MILSAASALVALTVALLGTPAAWSDERARPPHYQAECVACHEQMVSGDEEVFYTRPNRLVKNYAGLKRQVEHCQEQLELDWSEEQIESVVEYLSKHYYYDLPSDDRPR